MLYQMVALFHSYGLQLSEGGRRSVEANQVGNLPRSSVYLDCLYKIKEAGERYQGLTQLGYPFIFRPSMP